MVEIKNVIENIDDLTPNDNTSKGSNLIEPTEDMIESVITKLKNNESYKSIKRSVKKEGTNLTLSYGQIKEIEMIWKNTLIVQNDETGLMFLSDDGKVVYTKCSKCLKFPCECVVEDLEV